LLKQPLVLRFRVKRAMCAHMAAMWLAALESVYSLRCYHRATRWPQLLLGVTPGVGRVIIRSVQGVIIRFSSDTDEAM
jgi:hypothetical protein